LAASFTPGMLSQRLGVYPFSSFPMFSNIRAQRPYGVHLPYITLGQQLELVGDRPLSRAEQDVIDADIVYRRFFRLRDPAALRDALTVVVADSKVRFPDIKVRGARLWLVEMTVPPYPEPARLEVRRVAVMAELDGDRFHTQLA